MPVVKQASEFLSLLERSKLLDAPDLKTALTLAAELGEGADPVSVAEHLTQSGCLTTFQAEQLLAGRHKGFFVGKYKIMKLLGSGGMGKVYLSEHVIMRRKVALKVLPKGKGNDPSALARFQREARAIAQLNHPNIVQAYDFDRHADLYYMVMEYVDGMSIQEYVREYGTLPWPQAADYVRQAAAALQHANQAGIIHRDIKPGNLLVDRNGFLKILDMGLAVFQQERHQDPLTLMYDENVLGTADYLSPEQALDSHSVGVQSDIYSLGCTFYFMLTGGPLFPEGTIAQKLMWHQTKEPKPLREWDPNIPPEAEAIFQKMIAKKAVDRHQTAAELEVAITPLAVFVKAPYACKPLSFPGKTAEAPSTTRAQGPTDDTPAPASATFAKPTLEHPSEQVADFVPMPEAEADENITTDSSTTLAAARATVTPTPPETTNPDAAESDVQLVTPQPSMPAVSLTPIAMTAPVEPEPITPALESEPVAAPTASLAVEPTYAIAEDRIELDAALPEIDEPSAEFVSEEPDAFEILQPLPPTPVVKAPPVPEKPTVVEQKAKPKFDLGINWPMLRQQMSEQVRQLRVLGFHPDRRWVWITLVGMLVVGGVFLRAILSMK